MVAQIWGFESTSYILQQYLDTGKTFRNITKWLRDVFQLPLKKSIDLNLVNTKLSFLSPFYKMFEIEKLGNNRPLSIKQGRWNELIILWASSSTQPVNGTRTGTSKLYSLCFVQVGNENRNNFSWDSASKFMSTLNAKKRL